MQDTSYPVLESNGVLIDKNKYTVTVNGETRYIPKMQFELLYYFMSNTEKVISRDEFLTNVWKNINVDERTVDVHVRQLRKIIGNDSIVTVMKVGYVWKSH